MSPAPVARCAFIVAVPTLFAIASIGKLLAWPQFRASVESFDLVAPGLRPLGAILAPAIELLPILLILAGRPRAASVLCLILLAGLSGLAIAHLMLNRKPTCACLGLWAEYIRLSHAGWSIVIRNAILLGVASVGFALATPADRP